MAWRYLRSPRQEGFISFIAWFSFIGIALGVATLIIVMSVMNGFRFELLKTVVGVRGHIAIHSQNGPFEFPLEMQQAIQKIPGVVNVFPVVERQAILNAKGQARGVMVHAMSAEDFQKRRDLSAHITPEQISLFRGDTIFMGKRLAEILGIQMGDRINLLSPEGHMTPFGTIPKQKAFTVVGIFEVGMNEFDKNILFMPLESARGFFRLPGAYTNIEVFAQNEHIVPKIVTPLRKNLGASFNVLDWQHSDASIFRAVQVERNVMFLILTLIIVIASFNIISSLIMLVKDKTRDIAIMRTMGATKGSILRIFMMTGSAIGFIGTALGAIFGITFAANIEKIRRVLESFLHMDLFSAEIYFLTQLPSQLNLNEVFWVVLMALSLSFLATLYPAFKASKLDPAEALRF